MNIICCPNCGGYIEVESINCMIFRHAVYKINMGVVNPHSTDQQIENERDNIFGCGIQFKYNGIDPPFIFNESSP